MGIPNAARTAAITGASGGIGAATAKGLLRNLPHLSHLYLLCRNVEKAEIVAQRLRNDVPHDRQVEVCVLHVELADGRSVISCARGLTERVGRLGLELDLLICNAGIMATPLEFVRNEGLDGMEEVEKQFAVNHLSHALLTERLLGTLRSGDGGRVVFVSSMAAAFAKGRKTGPVVGERVRGVVREESYGRWIMYAESKLAMCMYAKMLGRREEGVVECVSLHPGVVQTELARYILPRWMGPAKEGGVVSWILSVFGFKTVEEGARLSVEIGCKGRGEVENGEMFVGVGGKKAPERLLPLLQSMEACQVVFEDTQRFVNAF